MLIITGRLVLISCNRSSCQASINNNKVIISNILGANQSLAGLIGEAKIAIEPAKADPKKSRLVITNVFTFSVHWIRRR